MVVAGVVLLGVVLAVLLAAVVGGLLDEDTD